LNTLSIEDMDQLIEDSQTIQVNSLIEYFDDIIYGEQKEDELSDIDLEDEKKKRK